MFLYGRYLCVVMYEDIIFLAQSTIREFEDLKRKLEKQAPQKEIDQDFQNILDRAELLREHDIPGAKRFYVKVTILKRIVDLRFSSLTRFMIRRIEDRLDSIEKQIIRMRNSALVAEHEQAVVRLRI
jgi:hypothetical protein